MKLSTSGGSFKVTDVIGDVDIRTSGGSIRLEQVRGEIDASTSGGSITARFDEPVSKDCDLHTSGGSVTAYLVKGARVNLDAESSGGRVRSDFDVDGFQDKHSARGTINGGGPRLQLNSSGGGVHIREAS